MCKERISAGIDLCLKHLLRVINEGGFKTIASCCGHGHQPGNIMLADGREIFIMPDWNSARQLSNLFRGINGELAHNPGILDHVIVEIPE